MAYQQYHEHDNFQGDTNDSTTHSSGQDNDEDDDCKCSFFPSPFSAAHRYAAQLEDRKEAIAALASKVDPVTRRRVVPMLQIVDLDYGSEPLLLLKLVEQVLLECQRHAYDFPWTFTLRESMTSAEVYIMDATGNSDDPAFEIVINTDRDPKAAYEACLSCHELQIAEAYMNGWLDVNGDLLKCILCFQDLWTKQQTNFWSHLFSRQSTHGSISKEARLQSHAQHYNRFENALLLALDNDFDLYSPGIYMYDEEDMEPAAQRKLAHAYEQLNLSKDATLLDVGCGWGGMMRYAANKGCHVTGITLSRHQAEYVAGHMKLRYFNTATVLCQDFFSYKPMFNNHHSNNGNNNGNGGSGHGNTTPMKRRSGHSGVSSPMNPSTPLRSPLLVQSSSPFRSPSTQHRQQQQQHGNHNNIPMETPSKTIGTAAGPMLYDAISIMGTLEELGGDYDKILSTLVTILKPGGRIYLDFAAETKIASTRPFVTKHVYPSASSSKVGGVSSARWVHLPRFLQAIDDSALVVDALWDNRHNYHLWAYKCYQKLLTKQEDFLQQIQQQRESRRSTNKGGSTSKIDLDVSTNNNMDPALSTTTSDDNDTHPSATTSHTLFSLPEGVATSGDDLDGEFLYRLLLSTFAGAAAAMMKQDYQCTAYRMVLKLPEGRTL